MCMIYSRTLAGTENAYKSVAVLYTNVQNTMNIIINNRKSIYFFSLSNHFLNSIIFKIDYGKLL